MTNNNYKTVNIPAKMREDISEIIESQESLGFVSVDDFVRESVRRNLLKYKEG